jgi:hypothetical protein
MSRRSRLLWTAAGSTLLLLVIAAGTTLRVFRGHGCALQDNAIANMRTLTTAILTYRDTYDAYPPTLAALGPPSPGQSLSGEAAAYISQDLASGNHIGYLFRYVRIMPSNKRVEKEGYMILADPIGEGPGRHHYFASDDAVIRSEESHPATAKSPPSSDPSCLCW